MKKVVIKIGGSVQERLSSSFFRDCANLVSRGWRSVIVHGGGPAINRWQGRMGFSPSFVNGLRVTDDTGLEVVEMVLAGTVNKSLVSRLEQAGASAVGLSGVDGGLIRVSQKDPALGWVGEVETVRPAVLRTLLEGGWLPVIASLGTDGAGCRYNVNADTAAGAIAGAIGAEYLVLVTDVPGIRTGDERVLKSITPGQIEKMVAKGEIHGGMIPKVEAAVAGLSQVKEVVILDGCSPGCLSMENGFLSGGTRIVTEEGMCDGAFSDVSAQ
ncbi:acetylglutamate kinase [Salinithrix halophila]|uniref:Acetylglutamate kinase n=1 Tax=Salinithrix halophila TaxID=1485204 RepID=A0ABV8JFS2_9BACL